MIFVTDSHAFLWYLANDERLSKNANDVFLKAEKGEAIIFIPTIALAECLYITEKYKFEVEFELILEKIRIAFNFQSYPLDIKVVERMQKLKKLRELHDRVVVATTQIVKGSCITKDNEIMESHYVRTIW